MLQSDGYIKGINGSPFAQNTKLGYILFGKLERKFTNDLSSFAVTIDYADTMDEIMKAFWEIEEVSSIREPTHDEMLCEGHFESTHFRTKEGRYTVFLPFNDDDRPLGRSREQAIMRLKQMENRFLKNPKLRAEYIEFMKDYLDSGHMEEIPYDNNSADNQICYLPHHGVIQNTGMKAKLRVVFDASSKTSSAISLNQKLRIGPKLQQNIFEIITRFRKHRFVFTADIRQMYRQILVAAEHRNYQRIVWRASPEEMIRDYRLCTVTYGTACAPYLAIRTVQQLAHDECEIFPNAAAVALTDFYVDDVLTGAENINDLLDIQRQLIGLLQRGGFELRKWSSNSQNILDKVPIEFHEHRSLLEMNWDESVKTLGLHWSPSADYFGFKVNLVSNNCLPTKRIILSESSKIFDPLGFLAPSVIIVKIMFQELWVLGLSWDEPIPETVARRWSTYRQNMRLLENIKIDRWLTASASINKVQIHGFSDASTKAYAAVVYARSILADGSKRITIIAAKTKVAPVKTISLPRLELCASLLLAKLMLNIAQSLNVSHVELFAWTDSQVVLGWLRSSPNRWKTFVANRVSQILSLLKPTEWGYVNTKQNPADCASRGIDPSLLNKYSLWWEGPDWLHKDEHEWPRHKINEVATWVDERHVTSMVATQSETNTLDDNEVYLLLTRCSTLGKLLRITVFCKRFIQNLHASRGTRNIKYITVPELNWAFMFWVKLVQKKYFTDEISRCQTGDAPLNKSSLCSLNPFIDCDGILRVGGRLRNSKLPYQWKHPLILPKDGQFTNLIISQTHLTTLHGGQTMMLAYLRKRYWIINVKNIVRLHVHRCVICFRYRPINSQQLMGDLPSPRVIPSRPFQHSGVDYAGPISIKLFKGRGSRSTKGYICLFVCLSTKAIHLEPASELTTNAFIAAFKRFSARRGKIQHLYSDCATNFIGSSRQLAFLQQRNTKELNPEIAALLAQDGTDWSFIPPASSHFGGLWEAGVKSVKHHLRRVMGSSLLTFEELTTLLCQIESCLNSRPLCPMSDDPDDYLVLTPGHFLIGESLTTIPEPSLLDVNLNRLDRYQHTQQMYQHFWKRWSHEYLSRLQQRTKWLQAKQNLTVGQLVLVKEDNCPPSKWLMGRIIETHPGADGLVRAATIQCQDSTFKRPVVKLCLLPILDNLAGN